MLGGLERVVITFVCDQERKFHLSCGQCRQTKEIKVRQVWQTSADECLKVQKALLRMML